MKTIKRPRLAIKIKAFVGNKMTMNTTYKKRLAALNRIKRTKADRWYLRVRYEDGGYNDGDYDNKTDLLFAFRCFTAKDEL